MDLREIVKTGSKILGLLAFVATGGSLLISAAIEMPNFHKTEIILLYGSFFAISLIDHYIKLTEKEDKNEN